MKKRKVADSPACLSMEVFQPKPNVLYTLDVAAHLAGAPRRSILLYCRVGLVKPVFQAPYGLMLFTEEAIHAIRRIESLRAVHGSGVAWIATVFHLVEEVERLRAEVRFLRDQ